MKRLFLFLVFTVLAPCQSVRQSTTCTSSSSPTTCTFSGTLLPGSFLINLTGNLGGYECLDTGTPATITDTRSSTFTHAIGYINVNGGQSTSCAATAPLASSGSDAITRTTSNPSNFPVAMLSLEVAGVSSPTVVSTSGGQADGGTTVNTGNVTSAASNLLLVCASSDNTANAYDSASPSGSTTFFVSSVGGFLYKFVGPGTYSCTFNKSAGGLRMSAVAALISYSPSVPVLSPHRMIWIH